MNIVSFTMVNNESEIIESFIRYNYNFVDRMFIIDNGCTDNTINILRKLINEGYNITIYDESLSAYDQFRLDNKYLNKIIDEYSPDMILPLDADEFLTGDQNPRTLLEKLSLDSIYYVHWQWYVMTDEDNYDDCLVPRRIKHHFVSPVQNKGADVPETKSIIPAQYYRKMNLTLSMGHHKVFGNNNAKITILNNIRLAHYRAISEEQIIAKTMCYTMRDIATMKNNIETAQRTNQMAAIEHGENMHDTVMEISRGGYEDVIIEDPIDLSFCDSNLLDIKYQFLSHESRADRVYKTGVEMAIRAYNSERSRVEKPGLKPVLVWLDHIRNDGYLFPSPSNDITLLASRYNVRGYLTDYDEVKFLKVNYRLIVTPDTMKFLPHQYVIIPNTVDFESVKSLLVKSGVDEATIISQNAYTHKLGLIKSLYSSITLIPSLIIRVGMYIERNGLSTTFKKIFERVRK
ncbi:glycosyltransferase family 2 protein [Bifidobacterium olomucense]|uniref:Glycosyl transferase n=1 Tax=Bifidobacterium olomucense TaxID=2675324 RepID=A0A7Y0HWE3_9BIFI|nr:glycosyltransferase family 2 protein [Bifidobacterium sp. DSM 109959]NMM99120.1 glycosyl transferase [Bifidobacterium sp. DSM 109959]